MVSAHVPSFLVDIMRFGYQSEDMRVTMSIDGDVELLLMDEVRRTGESRRQVVNRLLRCEFAQTTSVDKANEVVTTPSSNEPRAL